LYDALPTAHSFPTLRSSDLLEVFFDGFDHLDQLLASFAVLGAETFVQDQGLEPGAGTSRQQSGQGDPYGEVDPERLAAAVELVRSEEHTSELQSRFELVCRL